MEKRYKIEELEKYSKDWRESKDHIENTFIIGGLSLSAAVLGIGNYFELLHIPNSYTHNFIDASTLVLTCMGIPIGFTSLKELIRAIREKTILQNKIDEMNEEFDLLEIQEEDKSRGRR